MLNNQQAVQAQFTPGHTHKHNPNQGMLIISLFTEDGYPIDPVESFQSTGDLITGLNQQISDLTTQVTDLTARVTALEGA